MEALYASVRSWGMKEEDGIPFPEWKGVDEYWDPVDPETLSTNFPDLFPEVSRLLNSCVERRVVLNDITQDKNKVLCDESSKNVNLHRPERSIEEAVSTFKSVVELEEWNGGPQQKRPLAENETLPAGQTRNRGLIKP